MIRFQSQLKFSMGAGREQIQLNMKTRTMMISPVWRNLCLLPSGLLGHTFLNPLCMRTTHRIREQDKNLQQNVCLPQQPLEVLGNHNPALNLYLDLTQTLI